MEPLSRVVGSPQHNRLFGAKSREVLTDAEHRRSGQWRVTTPPPEEHLPKVIYVPLPAPPRTSTEDVWAQRLSQVDAANRSLCGLPPWPEAAHLPASCEPSETTQESQSTAPTSVEEPEAERRTFWRRLAAAFCLARA